MPRPCQTMHLHMPSHHDSSNLRPKGYARLTSAGGRDFGLQEREGRGSEGKRGDGGSKARRWGGRKTSSHLKRTVGMSMVSSTLNGGGIGTQPKMDVAGQVQWYGQLELGSQGIFKHQVPGVVVKIGQSCHRKMTNLQLLLTTSN